MKLGLAGVIGVTVVKSNGDIKYQSEFKNLITNVGLNALGVTSVVGASAFCRVGTGSVAPSVEQVDLISRFGDVSGGGGVEFTNSGEDPWWHAVKKTYKFSAGSVSGAALSEIGFFGAKASDSVMFSRALFKDADGSPAVISILDDEILFIDYTVKLYVPTDDFTGTLVINGVTHQVVGRAMSAPNSNSWGLDCQLASGFSYARFSEFHELLSYESSTPSRASSKDVDVSYSGYVDGDYSVSQSCSLGLSDANFPTGIGSIYFLSSRGGYRFQMLITPKIQKDDQSTLVMNSFAAFTWGRHGE